MVSEPDKSAIAAERTDVKNANEIRLDLTKYSRLDSVLVGWVPVAMLPGYAS